MDDRFRVFFLRALGSRGLEGMEIFLENLLRAATFIMGISGILMSINDNLE